MKKLIRTTCGMCYAGCGVLVHVENGRVTKVEGDPESPISKGAVCEKALFSPEILYHPERLKTPLKRAGKRGEGRWVRITWEEAEKAISHTLNSIKRRYGPESVVFIHGAAKGLQDVFLRRFANAFGSPNTASMGHVCFLPIKYGHTFTFGYLPCSDPVTKPSCIVVWGMRKPKIAEFLNILKEREEGSTLVVIDPFKTELAEISHEWIKPRPGSDLALALAMIHVLIEEELYDRNFVERWTVGFEKLRDHVKKYTPEWAENITWVSKEDIVRVARLYGSSRPAIIKLGNALEHSITSFQTSRAISILKAITGNLSIPGGEVYREPLKIRGRYDPELSLYDVLPEERKSMRLGREKGLPPFYIFSHPPTVVEAMLTGKPYPVRAAYIQGANPLITYPNPKRVLKALLGLEFIVVSDIFMTPTALFADIVIPSATFFEYDSVVAPPYYPMAQAQVKVAEIQGCMPDMKFINGLAKRMGLERYFFKDEREFLDLVLEPSGMSFEEFGKEPGISGEIRYHHYTETGFNTLSGKVEIYSKALEDLGIDPLPTYREPLEKFYREEGDKEKYPFILTSWKSPYFRHSGQRQVGPLRKLHPEPLVYINKKTAESLGIGQGDTVIIQTSMGSIKQKAVLHEDIHPKVVGVDYAWWFPEKGEKEAFGWDTANINILIDDGPPYGKELGTVDLRGIPCRLEKS